MPPRSTPPEPPRFLIVGEILRPHGIRGELRLRILTDYPERLTAGKQLYLGEDVGDTRMQTFTIEALRTNKEYGLLKLAEIDDRSTAELLRDLLVMIPLDQAVPLEEGEVYLFELIGMAVQTDTGESFGEIIDIIETGANDVYVVDSPQHGEVLLPAIDECILKIDAEARIVTIHLMDGLLGS
ncbi:MAG: 16S rRNA processing protein RimM [Phototrophicales bacterium]|nr:MAG: 16S rRNA processing protein RimM [Phototrophicales bacterium]